MRTPAASAAARRLSSAAPPPPPVDRRFSPDGGGGFVAVRVATLGGCQGGLVLPPPPPGRAPAFGTQGADGVCEPGSGMKPLCERGFVSKHELGPAEDGGAGMENPT